MLRLPAAQGSAMRSRQAKHGGGGSRTPVLEGRYGGVYMLSARLKCHSVMLAGHLPTAESIILF
jgi:hypothetical protein